MKHALEKRPYRLERADVVRAGLYRRDSRGFFQWVRSSTELSPGTGDAYGLEYHVAGGALSRTVPTVVSVFHKPAETAAERGVLVATYEPVS